MQGAGTPDYGIVRELAYGVALAALPTTLAYHTLGQFIGAPIRMTEIDAAALTEWSNHWHNFLRGHGGWDWSRIATYYRIMRDDSFEVAIWHDTTLCGLAAGMGPRYGRVEVDLIEGSWDRHHPLKGAVRYAVMEAAKAYAVSLGLDELRLNYPAPGLLTKYEQMGFTLNPPYHPYCWMKVTP